MGIKLKEKDFTFSADSRGYMIKYKGFNIGGASIRSDKKMHWRHAQQNVKDNATSARSAISQIITGNGGKMFNGAIRVIQQRLIKG
jgi:hypothetical protein